MKPADHPAFPVPMIPINGNPGNGFTEVRETGMTLRDFFAAFAMHAEFLSDASGDEEVARAFIEGAQKHGHTIQQHLAFNAYEIADAMIAERERRGS